MRHFLRFVKKRKLVDMEGISYAAINKFCCSEQHTSHLHLQYYRHRQSLMLSANDMNLGLTDRKENNSRAGNKRKLYESSTPNTKKAGIKMNQINSSSPGARLTRSRRIK